MSREVLLMEEIGNVEAHHVPQLGEERRLLQKQIPRIGREIGKRSLTAQVVMLRANVPQRASSPSVPPSARGGTVRSYHIRRSTGIPG
jgi:hypothetical protein